MKKKIFSIIGFVILIIGMIFGISNLAKNEVQAAGTLVSGEQDPSKYPYSQHIFTAFSTGNGPAGSYNHSGSPAFIPTNGNYQIYCIQPGIHINYRADITYERAMSLKGKTYTAKSGHAARPYDEYKTISTYKAIQENGQIVFHDLPRAVAYIVSDQPRSGEKGSQYETRPTTDKWSLIKQRGIWNLRGKTVKNFATNSKEPADGDFNMKAIDYIQGNADSRYDSEARVYAEYDSIVRGKGLQPKNNTNMEKLYVKADQATKKYTIGPLNISYNRHNLEGIINSEGNLVGPFLAFSGISKITLIGYDKDGKVLNDNIKIEGLRLKKEDSEVWNNEIVTPEYFEPNKTEKVDRTKQVYPKPNQDFEIIFKDPNEKVDTDNRITSIGIKIEFKYMLADGKYIKLDGYKWVVKYNENHKNPNYSCVTTCYVETQEQQDLISTDAIRTLYEEELQMEKIDLTTDLGGHVWEDVPATKEGKVDGISNTSENIDKSLANIKVTLYEYDQNGKAKVATLLSDPNAKGINGQTLMNRINPTYTNSDGNYMFEGLDPMRRYYVTFEYNGQTYMPTEYLNTANKQYKSISEMLKAGLHNTDAWKYTSKGTEVASDRDKYTSRFGEIGPYSPSGGTVQAYYTTFTHKDLMGYTLNAEGKYEQTGVQLIDGYLYDDRGLETENYSEGEITRRVKEYINTNKKYPDEAAMKVLYQQIAGQNAELAQKIQFVKDTTIQAHTGSPFNNNGNNIETYPVVSNTNEAEMYVNLGLCRRPEFDAALQKDVYKVALKINNKTAVYDYDDRGDSDSWDINVRMSDYTYYSSGYNRELYKSDYDYAGKEGHPALEIFVTYKLTIRNQSQSILGEIKEVVDYYDSEYTFKNNLSWIGAEPTTEVYYNAMVNGKISNIEGATGVNSSDTSKYGSQTQKDMSNKNLKAVYISGKGLEGTKLSSGGTTDIYLTFQVNKKDNKVILDGGDNSSKQNFAEINGYVTYYKDNTSLPNGITKGSNDKAGLIDRDSTPGNLVSANLEGERYEKNFEDDTDRARGLNIFVDEENGAKRRANGVVWEDERTVNVENAIIGDGVRQDGEVKVEGIDVELVEINGAQNTMTATTGEDGVYNFEGYIPGDYRIVFKYGNTEKTALIDGFGGLNSVSYNGQDFKSTTYHQALTGKGDYTGANDIYDIAALDGYNGNLSDAKDSWTRRKEINDEKFKKNVKNDTAEFLALPYSGNKEYIDSKKEDFIKATNMTAETGKIVAEIEYNKTHIGADDKATGNYTLKNIDLGLEERPKAQLEIDKSVTNVKVRLANGSILFDVNETADNVIWKDHEEYNLMGKMENGKYKDYYGVNGKHRYSYKDEIMPSHDSGLIQITMDEELMHGATIEISYNVKVTNVGETDYDGEKFYYLGQKDGNIITTQAHQVVDYISNNLQYDSSRNEGWNLVKADDLMSEGLVNVRLENQLKQFNNIIKTEKLNKVLKPGESTENQSLVLTQLITTENTSDDLTYENITEIVETTNTAGRRMAYSIVGNQDPTTRPAEVDSSMAEQVIILPPFGEMHIYYILSAVIGVILIAGIAVIIKKVLKK